MKTDDPYSLTAGVVLVVVAAIASVVCAIRWPSQGLLFAPQYLLFILATAVVCGLFGAFVVAGNLRPMPKKRHVRIELLRTSSLNPEQLVRYFTDPELLKLWFCSGSLDVAERVDGTNRLAFGYGLGQDHIIWWDIGKMSADGLDILQTSSLDQSEGASNVRVHFEPDAKVTGATSVQVVIEGELFPWDEETYREDWQNLEKLP